MSGFREPENCQIGRRLLEPSYEHDTEQLCSVNRPIWLNKWFKKLPVKLFDL